MGSRTQNFYNALVQRYGFADAARKAQALYLDGQAGAAAAALPESLIDLVTPDYPTEYRVGLENFYVLTRYNRSSFYASAVMDLAQSLRFAMR